MSTKLQPGRYMARFESGTTSLSKNGNPQVVIDVTVGFVLDQAANQWVEVPGNLRRRIYLSMADAAEQYTVQKLEAMGFTGNFDKVDVSDEFKVNGLEFNCSEEEGNNGRLFERWDLANWGDGNKVEAAPSSITKTLNAKWKQQAARNKAPAGKPAAPATEKAINADTAWTEVYNAWGDKAKTDEGAARCKAGFDAAVTRVSKKSGLSKESFSGKEWHEVIDDASLPF